MHWVVTSIYGFSLLYIFLFSVAQLHLTWLYIRRKEKKDLKGKASAPTHPVVTVQLPVFNERYVVERLIEAVSKLDYPKEKLEIQILDDSTDDTTQIILKKIESLRALAMDIKLIHREHRRGYKAGALEEGLKIAKGDYIAIFDADFIPEKDFLYKTLPFFADSQTGAVQTRWGHINKNYSLLTQLQAFALDAHFSIEQTSRNSVGSFINFNGTCGVWRKSCIIDAGGWSSDTLTEDLDLSYRAQLKGWQFKYLEGIVTPGELPVIMPAIKAQQYRWNKGGAETAKKIFGKVISARLSIQQTLHAFFHLFNSSVFLCVLLAAISSVPMMLISLVHPELDWMFSAGNILLAGFLSISVFYYVATMQFNTRPLLHFLRLFPPFLFVSMGLSLHNGLAVAEGLMGFKTPFIRTPKFNIKQKGESWKNNVYMIPALNLMTVFEGLLCLYFIGAIILGVCLGTYLMLVFHAMLAIGFGFVFYFSVKPLTHA